VSLIWRAILELSCGFLLVFLIAAFLTWQERKDGRATLKSMRDEDFGDFDKKSRR
jgi:uncharacterized protein YjiS (DUF1127 family)